MPNSIVTIEEYAFNDCKYLTSITLGDNVERIPKRISMNNLEEYIVSEKNRIYSSLDGVLFNKSQTGLAAYPMALVKKHKPNGQGSSYTIPDGVVGIYPYAFIPIVEIERNETGDIISAEYYRLETLIIPASVQTIGEHALYGVLNIHCKGEIPPNFSPSYPLLTDINIYVPVSAVNIYKQADGWKEGNIIGE